MLVNQYINQINSLSAKYYTQYKHVYALITEPKYKWTVDAYTKQGIALHPGRKQLPYLFRRSKTYQHIQNKPLHRYYTELDLRPERSHEESKPEVETTSQRKKLSAFLTSTDSLPRFVPRPKFEPTLLRRPTVVQTQPLLEDDSMFKTFTKSVELKPRNFKTSTEQDIFYNKNYPLLLDAYPEEEKAAVPRKRAPTPEKPIAPDVKRAVTLLARLDNLEMAVDTLEKETEDIDFKTVLREDVFYPTIWPWNVGRRNYCPPSQRHTPSNYGSPSPTVSPTLSPVDMYRDF